MPRGGRRAGAGAPKGNLNALKHGRNSEYVQALQRAVASNPATRDVLIRMALRNRARQRLAERTAALIVNQLIDRDYPGSSLRALEALKNNLTEEGLIEMKGRPNQAIFSELSKNSYENSRSIKRPVRGRPPKRRPQARNPGA